MKVSVFHEFYTHVEYLHHANDIIFVENIVSAIKPSMKLADENSECPNGDEASVIRTFDEKLRHERKPRESIESEESRFANTSHYEYDDDNAGINIENESSLETELVTEKQQKPNIEQRERRGRSHREKQMQSDDANRTEKTEIKYELNINNEPQRKRGRPRKDDPVKPRSTK